jgi:hypothetical protein
MRLASVVMRVQKLVQSFRDARQHSGSSVVALGHVSRLVARNLPVAVRQARSIARYRTEARKIIDTKARANHATPFLGIKVTGGLGDSLVIARFIRDLSAYVGGFDFDIYTTRPESAQWVFGAVDGLRGCHDELLFDFTLSGYDLAACVNQFVTFNEKLAQWTRLRPHPKLVQAASNAIRFRPKIEPFIQNHPYMDAYLAQKAVYSNRNRADFLHHMAGIPYGGDRLDLAVAPGTARHYGLTPKRYITIHNGFDPEFFTSNGQATKCYPHFGAVISLLRQKWSGLQFVQIGVATSQPLQEVDLNLVNLTSQTHAAGLIGDALLHIDNEGGLVHLARCLGVDSCVVFGPTPSNYFGYAGNINIDPAFCGGCWWNNETWMDRCPRGFETARCMTEQNPKTVAAAIDRHLSRKLLPQRDEPAKVGVVARMPAIGRAAARRFD